MQKIFFLKGQIHGGKVLREQEHSNERRRSPSPVWCQRASDSDPSRWGYAKRALSIIKKRKEREVGTECWVKRNHCKGKVYSTWTYTHIYAVNVTWRGETSESEPDGSSFLETLQSEHSCLFMTCYTHTQRAKSLPNINIRPTFRNQNRSKGRQQPRNESDCMQNFIWFPVSQRNHIWLW